MGTVSAALALGAGATACDAHGPSQAPDLGGHRAKVELHDLAETFDFAFVPPAPLAPGEPLAQLRDRLERFSFPVQATGAIIIPFRDAQGAPITRFGKGIRGSCGATLISPSYVVTAAHCVDRDTVFAPQTDQVTLELFRPTQKLARDEVWQPKTKLSGTFPDYQHERFTADDGYFVDSFACKVAARCQDDFNCPPSLRSKDLALLYCPDRPGERYGSLGVAREDIPNSEVFVPWKHEVYDIPDTLPTTADLYQHYVKYPASLQYWENYHYVDDHQLLPLVSAPWPDGAPRRKVGPTTGSLVWTDVLACHGTSGSGFLQHDANSGAWELLGPTVAGGSAIGGVLCQHLPGLLGTNPPLPGGEHIGYASHRDTRALLDGVADWKGECTAQPAGYFTLGGRDACQRAQSNLTLLPRRAYADFDPWTSPVLALSVGTGTLGTVVVESGETYRLSLGAVPDRGCAPDASGLSVCPEVVVRVGDQEVLRTRVEASAGRATSVGSLFTATTGGSLPVTLTLVGTSFELGELSIVPNVVTHTFDSAYDRAETALVVPAADATAALPMRFTGDGKQGFAALLYAGERLVLSRAAVALRGRYALRFQSPAPQPLRCGLLARDGSELVGAPCNAGDLTLLEVQGSEVAVSAFVEGAPAEGAEIDDVTLVLEEPTHTSHCDDGALSGDESDVDCGGACVRCGDGRTCAVETDCVSTSCVNGSCACRPTTCAEAGKDCGSIADGCGDSIACGACVSPSTCGGNGTENLCGCAEESDASFCTRLGKTCGAVSGLTNCGAQRTVASCGSCTSPNTCGGGGVPNVCGFTCLPESNAAFCARRSKNCGTLTGADNCGTQRTVASCGSCTSPNTCGGGGVANVCGLACVPESNAALCSRRGKNCGSITSTDNCGTTRTVASCGTCTAPNTCGGAGTANVCGINAPACWFRYAQGDCLTYTQGQNVSANGRNWTCSNGNCMNCAGFASCAPGGTGCPWGVVWTDNGPCK